MFCIAADLNNSVTFGILKLSGNTLFSKDKLNRYFKGSQSLPKQRLIALNLISSPLGHLFVFIEKKTFSYN